MEAICSKCRKKDLAEHHCRNWVHQEQPKRLLRCTCPCHTSGYSNEGTVEERRKGNDEIVARSRGYIR